MDQQTSIRATHEDNLYSRIRVALLEFFKVNTQEAKSAKSRSRALLRQIIAEYFNEGDLRTLCFDLGVDYEDIPAQGKTDKVRELITYFERRGRIYELIVKCRELRRNVRWPDTSEMAIDDGCSPESPRSRFDSILSNIFDDPRLQPWRDELPKAYNLIDSVDAIMGYLRYQFGDNQENALILFLRALGDKTHPESVLRHRLISLADELSRAVQRSENSFVDDLRPLGQQLKDWKEAHNLLHSLYKHLDLLKPYIHRFNKLRRIPELCITDDQTLSDFETVWRAYRSDLSVFLKFVEGVQVVGETFHSSLNLGPTWFAPLREGSDAINQSLLNSNVRILGDELSEFCDRVSVSFYLVDKALYEVASQIQGLASAG